MIFGLAVLPLSFVFVIVGLFLILLELGVGVETGLDMVFIGSALIIGGLASWVSHSWLVAVIVTCAICVAYVALGRRYIHRRMLIKKEQTNIDAIIGRRGIVLKSITKNVDGLVKIGNERWRARAEENIKKGDEIIVNGISGVTLIVEKFKGGN